MLAPGVRRRPLLLFVFAYPDDDVDGRCTLLYTEGTTKWRVHYGSSSTHRVPGTSLYIYGSSSTHRVLGTYVIVNAVVRTDEGEWINNRPATLLLRTQRGRRHSYVQRTTQMAH